MGEFPLGYKIIPSVSWAYLSSLLMIALYFKFNRFFSVRNLDLMLIILLAPGLLTVVAGSTDQQRVIDELRTTAVLSEAKNEPKSDLKTEPAGESPAAAQASQTDADGEDGSATEGDKAKLPEDSAARVVIPEEMRTRYSKAESTERFGYILLFIAAALFAIRMLIDPMMVRRPQLEPNMTFGGLTFLGAALLLFLILNVILTKPTRGDLYGARKAIDLMERRSGDEPSSEQIAHGPGYGPIFLLPTFAVFAAEDQFVGTLDESNQELRFVFIAKLMAVLCQLAIVGGLFYIGYRHFDNARMGIGIAVLYLMLPYTAEMSGRVIHVLPAALLIWAVAFYRRPILSGLFVGLAMGVFYYPMFLLPLWISFYWRRGRWRFLTGVSTMVAVLAISLAFVSNDLTDYLTKLQNMFGAFAPRMENLQGIWGLGWNEFYRLPVIAFFVAVSIAFILWPAQKNLGTLICCSCALMAIVQIWHAFGGGLFMGWYLPLGLLAIFRPNLEDRVALSALSGPRRKRKTNGAEKIRPAA